MYFKDANVTITSADLTENSVRKSTGFILVQGCAYFLIESTNMTRNQAMKDNGLMRIDMSAVTILRTRFTENSALGSIGVLTASDSTLFIQNTTFLRNFAKKQIGTLLIQESEAIIDDVLFDSNYVYFGTIGVLTASNTRLTLTNSIFINNWALESCAAIFLDSAESMLSNLLFKKNVAMRDSGGSLVVQYSHAIFQNISFTNNTAQMHGGALYLVYSNVEVNNNCSFTFNTAVVGSGGAIFAKNSSLNFKDANF